MEGFPVTDISRVFNKYGQLYLNILISWLLLGFANISMSSTPGVVVVSFTYIINIKMANTVLRC